MNAMPRVLIRNMGPALAMAIAEAPAERETRRRVDAFLTKEVLHYRIGHKHK